MRKIDLHCHSNVSDGTLAPAAVAARAKANGVDLWALTDHDEVSGVAEAREAAGDLGLDYVPGVEISVTWAGETVHIVGLNIDETNADLVAGLAETRDGRGRRAEEMARQLEAAGVPEPFFGALKYVGNPDLISRTHFARHLVEVGVCKDIADVFRNYLVSGKPGFVPIHWATLKDAVRWIRGAGGMAIIAHPGRYKYSDLEFNVFLDEFKQAGGVGIEVITASHTPDQFDYYARVAQSHGLLASCGSDFHAPDESRFDLGALPPLPSSVVPVWQSW